MASAPVTEAQLHELLDFNSQFNVQVFDNVVETMYSARDEQQRKMLQSFLTTFQEHPASWTRVDTILQSSPNPKSKFLALQILSDTIQHKWRALPMEQREAIKGFLVPIIIRFSSDEASMAREKMYIGKLNVCLVQILKQDWPQNWKGFIPQLIESGQSNEILCENNMNILRLLSEEIFDFGSDQMTSSKMEHLKRNLTEELGLIFQFCEFVLQNATRPSLQRATLQCLQRYLTWIDTRYIFDTALLEMLCIRFLGIQSLGTETMKCLSEVSSVDAPESSIPKLQQAFASVVNQVKSYLPQDRSVTLAQVCDADDRAAEFVRMMVLFFTSFFRKYIRHVETGFQQQVLEALKYVVQATLVDEDEILGICLDFWNWFAEHLFQDNLTQRKPSVAQLLLSSDQGSDSARLAFYGDVLQEVRSLMILRMAKPEEVLVVVDPNGDVVREHLKDVEELARHRMMADTMVYLTHLSNAKTQQILLDNLDQQTGGDWSKQSLCQVCWAIGCISGAMPRTEEKKFLVHVIKELLTMCEHTRGKPNKAIIASNIMYVVGQYPRFMRQHWRFLKTVINKLFEFMHESHPGVQDMAVETFNKIAQKCAQEIVKLQEAEQQPFISEILTRLPKETSDLESHQVNLFYETCGLIIAHENNRSTQASLVQAMFSGLNSIWSGILKSAITNPAVLEDFNTARQLTRILVTNTKACDSLKAVYLPQLAALYEELQQLYRVYSELIQKQMQMKGPIAIRTSEVVSFKSVKSQILRLLSSVVKGADDVMRIMGSIVSPILDTLLADYLTAPDPDLKDPELLQFLAATINKCGKEASPLISRIFDSTFGCTTDIIKNNFEDFPDHRIGFYKLLEAINSHCFQVLINIPTEGFSMVINAVVWAFRHTERSVAELGLKIAYSMLDNVIMLQAVAPQQSASFYSNHFMQLVIEVLTVLTDTLHKPGFANQAAILRLVTRAVASNQLNAPIYSSSDGQFNSNFEYLVAILNQRLSAAFPNLNADQVRTFVQGLFDVSLSDEQFRTLLRDFLVQMKEFGGADDVKEMYGAEKQLQNEASQAEDMAKRSQVAGLLPVMKREDEA